MVAGATLPFSGALEIDLLDTPTPASTGNFSVTINASAGTANVNTTGLPNVVVSSNNSAAVTLSGPLSELNSALATLTYSNPTAAATPATLALTARDSASTPLSDSKTVYIRAFDPATAPTITTALANVNYYAETTTVTEAAISFTVSDPQGSAGVTVTGTSSNTNLILNTDFRASFIFLELLWNEKMAKNKVFFGKALYTFIRSLLYEAIVVPQSITTGP